MTDMLIRFIHTFIFRLQYVCVCVSHIIQKWIKCNIFNFIFPDSNASRKKNHHRLFCASAVNLRLKTAFTVFPLLQNVWKVT